jgi:hypothetical protein
MPSLQQMPFASSLLINVCAGRLQGACFRNARLKKMRVSKKLWETMKKAHSGLKGPTRTRLIARLLCKYERK